ncbi:MAG TPA: hypothetical protein VIR33_12880 [Thermopolyspora sp.]|jgi:hypothetical protein
MLVYILAIGAAIAVVIIAAVLFRRLGRDVEDRDPSGVTAGHAGSMLSALFLLAFAIAIVVPWTSADSARQNTYTESQAIVDAYWSSTGLPAAEGQQLQGELRDYVRFVLDREWRLMADGRLSLEGWSRLDTMRAQLMALKVTGALADARDAALEKIRDISTARRQRAADAMAEPPPALLLMTVLTGLAVTIFPFLAGARPRGLTVVPLVLMAALLGVGIYMAFDIAHVFAGGLAVKPDAFTAALQEFQRVPGGQ